MAEVLRGTGGTGWRVAMARGVLAILSFRRRGFADREKRGCPFGHDELTSPPLRYPESSKARVSGVAQVLIGFAKRGKKSWLRGLTMCGRVSKIRGCH